MAMTLRLPDALKNRAQARADQIGIPVSGLLAVALQQYLNELDRADAVSEGLLTARAKVEASTVPGVPRSAKAPASAELVLQWLRVPAAGPRVRCPCGSRMQWRHCHGRKPAGEAQA